MAKKRAARPARKTRKAAQRKATKAAARVRRSASKAATKARKAAKKAKKSVAKARKRATGRLAATRTRAAKAARAAKRKTKKTAKAARKSLASARKKVGRATSKAAAKARRAPRKSKAAVKKATSQIARAAAPAKALGSARTTARAVVAGVTAAVTPPRTKESARRPNIDRPRRTVADIRGVPSTLDRERTPSAATTGRAEFEEKLQEHTSTSPALTAGDVDADWASAESVGDEAPGGDNPTPDQDVVDEIGRALGVEYDDDEELRGGEEISARDRHRWELDPDSKDDFDDES